MSMRQLHEVDPVETTVTDENGQRQGILVARYGEWCWVQWADLDSPTTQHVGSLWICEKPPSLLQQISLYTHDWMRPHGAVGA